MKIIFFHPASLIATFFGIGKIKFMPGTFGSIMGVFVTIVFWFISIRDLEVGNVFGMGVMIEILLYDVLLFIIGMLASDYYCKLTEQDDPGEVVIDEVVGQISTIAFTILLMPLYIDSIHKYYNHEESLIKVILAIIAATSFLLFRFFDIVKPWPIGWFDRAVKGGFGIMLDDVIASIVAALFNAVLLGLIFDLLS